MRFTTAVIITATLLSQQAFADSSLADAAKQHCVDEDVRVVALSSGATAMASQAFIAALNATVMIEDCEYQPAVIQAQGTWYIGKVEFDNATFAFNLGNIFLGQAQQYVTNGDGDYATAQMLESMDLQELADDFYGFAYGNYTSAAASYAMSGSYFDSAIEGFEAAIELFNLALQQAMVI